MPGPAINTFCKIFRQVNGGACPILPYLLFLVSQSVFVNEDIYRINKLTTTDKALYRFYVADKSVPPIYLRELSQLHHEAVVVHYFQYTYYLLCMSAIQLCLLYFAGQHGSMVANTNILLLMDVQIQSWSVIPSILCCNLCCWCTFAALVAGLICL